MKGLLRAIAGRCETHDRAAYVTTVRLERELGMPESPPPASFTDEHMDPGLIDCGNRRCRTRRNP
ncbi:hypothetical protein ACFWNK_01835 [Streptomyces sp. NPDC058417]|uniref:hypothetical protein n=1 Tax=unclassified Streptomyces TaxID=2593676 RepID=UPI00365F754F